MRDSSTEPVPNEPADTDPVDTEPRAASPGRWMGSLTLVLVALIGIGLLVKYRLPKEESPADLADANDDRWAPILPRTANRPPRSSPTDAAAAAANQAAPELTFEALPKDLGERITFLRNEAIETAERLMQDLPEEPDAISLRALLFSRFGETDKAIATWEQCLELDPQFSSAYNCLGTAAMEQEQYEKAEEYFRQALELKPDYTEARASLAESFMKRSRFQDAIEVLEQDMATTSDSLTSLFHLGQAHLQLGEPEQAIKYFTAAIKIEPNLTNAYYGLANAYRRTGERQLATDSLQKFRELKELDLQLQKQLARNSDDESALRNTTAFVHYLAGNVYSQHRQLTAAVAHWIRAAKLDPKQVTARSKLSRIFTQTGDLDKVVLILKELQAIEETNPIHLLNLGMIHTRMRDYEKAEQAYREAIELAPDSPIAMMALAEFLVNSQRNLPEARRLAEDAVSREATPQNYAVLATVCANMQDYAAALRSIEQAIELDPRNPEFRNLRLQLKARLDTDQKGK